MQVSFLRGDHNECVIVVHRDDGVVLRAVQPVRGARAPHDLVHFAVEGALELGQGFWGCAGTAEVLTGAVERLARLGWGNDRARLLREVDRQLSNCEPPRPAICG